MRGTWTSLNTEAYEGQRWRPPFPAECDRDASSIEHPACRWVCIYGRTASSLERCSVVRLGDCIRQRTPDVPRVSTRSPASHSSSFPSGRLGRSNTLNRSTMSLKRTSPEPFTSRLQLVKMYPTEPLSDGRAFIEYVVLKRGLGDLEIPKCSPLGTLKSRRAVQASGRCPPT